MSKADEARRWRVLGDETSLNLGQFLRVKIGEQVAMRALKRALEGGAGRINGGIERFASARLKRGDAVSFRLGSLRSDSHGRRDRIVSIRRVLKRDADFVVIDKPAGLAAHEDPKNPQRGLEAALRQLAKALGVGRLLPAHRLDRDTSGALLLACDEQSRKKLFEAFRQRRVLKAYEAVVHGELEQQQRVLRSTLARVDDVAGQARWASQASRAGGLEAVTELRVLARGHGLSLVRLYPKTGRTHQLRVQLSELGHPIVGDLVYGDRRRDQHGAERHMLHARGLVFPHPKSGARCAVEAHSPKDFEALRRTLDP